LRLELPECKRCTIIVEITILTATLYA
jgi:hypothetical protein